MRAKIVRLFDEAVEHLIAIEQLRVGDGEREAEVLPVEREVVELGLRDAEEHLP